LTGVLVTTLVAGLATAPFALYHFGRLAVFGLVANIGAVPITAFWVMPFATLGYVLMPFGLESLALAPMGWGIDSVNSIAKAVAARPGASFLVPALPIWGLGLITFGGLWLCLWQRRWRVMGAVAIAAGLSSIWMAPPPDLLISGDGKSFAVRNSAGQLIFARKKGSRFQRDMWMRRSGIAPASHRSTRREPPRPASGSEDMQPALRCDHLGCVAHIRGHRVSLIRNIGAIREDCAHADLVIALVGFHRISCKGPKRIITRRQLRRSGTHAVWMEKDGKARVETVAEGRGHRPWTGGASQLR
jgi:competence protein ComEC